jgi:hypothetical protein
MYRSLQARLEDYPYSHTQNAALPEWIAEADYISTVQIRMKAIIGM